jgi:hypothetical protein
MFYIYFIFVVFFFTNLFSIFFVNEEFLIFLSLVMFFSFLYIFIKKSIKFFFFYKVERIYLYFSYLLSVLYNLVEKLFILLDNLFFIYNLNFSLVKNYLLFLVEFSSEILFLKQQTFLKVKLFSIFSKLCYYNNQQNFFFNYFYEFLTFNSVSYIELYRKSLKRRFNLYRVLFSVFPSLHDNKDIFILLSFVKSYYSSFYLNIYAK